MSFALAALTAGWCAAAGGMLLLSLPAASVAKLLPPRWARLRILCWLTVATTGVVLFFLTLPAASAWAREPLGYTPHLERPLPHLCFLGAAHGWLGVGLVRIFSLGVASLLVAAGVRMLFVLAALFSESRAAKLAAGQPADPPIQLQEVSPSVSVLVTERADTPVSTRGLLRPTTYVASDFLRGADAATLKAVLAHEADHVRWRDPLLQSLLASLALAWPLPGLLILREVRQASELAADAHARSSAGAEVCRKAIEMMAAKGDSQEVAERLRALEQTKAVPPSGAVAAGASWLLVGTALLVLYWRPAFLSLICLFETVAAAWK